MFEDIMPIFTSPQLHSDLITALELQINESFPTKPDVIVALESRGFLFGPTLALRLGCSFVPVRKPGKLPGPVETATFVKEYGKDEFQMQQGAIKEGQTVIVVDDLLATGGSAGAAGTLVKKSGGKTLGYLFLIELGFLDGKSKLDAPVYTVLKGQDEAEEKTAEQKLPLGQTKEKGGRFQPVQDAGGAAAETRL